MKKIFLKSIIPVLGIVFFYACSPKIIQNIDDDSEESDFVDFIENLRFHQNLKIDSVLNSYNNKISDWKENEVINPLDTLNEDTGDVVFVGKFINKKDVFAINVYGDWSKQKIDFYKFDIEKGNWYRIKSDNYNSDYSYVDFKNFNDDEDNEIIFFGSGNMNGNRLNTIYKYDAQENKFVKSCSLFTSELTYDSKSSLVRYDYSGSYYMDQIQAEYKWNKNKLIPIREIRKRLKIRRMTDEVFDAKEIICYYENPTHDKDTLVLKFRKKNGRKGTELWENFFENE